jgi:NAD(P)-dependent dehydrogenase (short-subunit alcohol dehydrogenase family)
MLRPGLAYAVSKNFVIWYSKSLAKRLGQRGARIVSVSPGSIDTEMGRLEEAAGAGALARKSSLGRFGRVEEIAEVLSFCASGKPGYLTGTDVLVDGGGRVNSRS